MQSLTPEIGFHSHRQFLCAHFNVEFNMCMYQHDFVISQLLWEPIVIQYVTYTCVMWKLVVLFYVIKHICNAAE